MNIDSYDDNNFFNRKHQGRQASMDTECKNCQISSICGGLCMSNNMEQHGKIKAITNRECNYRKEVYSELIYRISKLTNNERKELVLSFLNYWDISPDIYNKLKEYDDTGSQNPFLFSKNQLDLLSLLVLAEPAQCQGGSEDWTG
jgi:hypothetical protein